ncbi:hypothetical protein [Streptomyces sp. TBY4]|uniref:hypothetical protein n=1 Tax=Streptomyces sp. TBY4 TaxID=2962030 RepID=UPI0020B7D6E2|nr:hypothetical protein [Streptomyces sp. TBY4]MCP3760739.1 hypothetical protein [Streptomyces sp. TBY4]
MFETTNPMPGHLRLIWIGNADVDSGRRQVFSDTISRCTWTNPTTWDTSGRLLVRSALGQQAHASAPLESGVVSRNGDGCETLRSTCGHLLHLDGRGSAIVDTPDGIQDAPVTGVFFIHDPECTAARRTGLSS